MIRSSTITPESASVDELVKGKNEQDEDHSSSLNLPKLPMRRYLQDTDFMKREFLIDPPTVCVAMKSAEYEQSATFCYQGEKGTANQLTWQDEMETGDYMTLVGRPEDSETSDYMTLVGRPEDSETSDYMTLVRRPEDSETSDYMTLVRRPDSEDSETSDYMCRRTKDSHSVYQSLTYNREMPYPSASGKRDEGFQSTENIYQPLDLSRMKKFHDSSTYQTLFPFYKD